MTNEIAVREPTSALAITTDQREFNDAQVAALLQLAGVKDAPPAQLAMFFHRCRTTGLDPFARQIYLIGRKTKTGGYNGEPAKYETTWTIQTGIHGYRLNGRRAAQRAGHRVQTEGPFWKGPDGGDWLGEWLGGKGKPPAVAKFVVFVDGEPNVGIAHYDEFVQTKYNGDPNSMWAKMPANQLAKCAEAQGWQKAFPDDFSGLLLEDAVQSIEPDGMPSPTRVASERVAPTAAEIIAAPASDPGSTPAAAKASPADPVEPRITAEQSAAIGEHLRALEIVDEAEQLRLVSEVLGRPVTGPGDLTEVEATKLVDDLAELRAAEAAPIEAAAQ
ncbi:RecT family recombinase [Nocardia sp. NPDC059240]|uniref:RecT family recombinase n=1 Tax=Nocardia sp. NPDC059240 TaxID=3346786 RepID=UPI0036BEC50C